MSKNDGAVPPDSSNRTLLPDSASLADKTAPALPPPTVQRKANVISS